MNYPSGNQSELTAVDFNPFADGELLLTAPATESQKEIWASVQMGSDANCAYNESQKLWLRGLLNVGALRSALQELVLRHESLRTTFSPDGVNLCIIASLNLEIPEIDLSGLDSQQQDAKLSNLLQQAVESPFDLEHGPLIRVKIIKTQHQEHLLLLTAHHIICDGWSWGVMMHDLGKLYSGLQNGTMPDIGEPDKFSDYVIELESNANSSEAFEVEHYWLNQFADSVPILDLPTDFPRPPLRSFASKCETRQIDNEIVLALKQLGAKLGCSFMTLALGAFEIFLHRLTGQIDLVVGVPAAGQAATDRYNLVGHCVNLLPLRTKVDPNQLFSDYIIHRKPLILDAYDNQQFTFGRLIRQLSIPRDSSRIPLVSTIFNIDRALEGEQLPFLGLEVEFNTNPRTSENFELSVNLTETSDRFTLEWEYSTQLFSRDTAQRQIAAFETLLNGIVTQPNLTISRLPFLPESDRQLLSSWNQTQVDCRTSITIHELFEDRVERTPSAVAVKYIQHLLTYKELNDRANQLAHYLRSLGIKNGDRIGIFLNRSIEMPIAFLGALKAGSAYVPLDPNYPAERLDFMVRDSQLKVILTCSSLKDLIQKSSILMLCLDADWLKISQFGIQNPVSIAGECDAAYMIYTSGSTGVPKGVLVAHRGLVNHCQAMVRAFELEKGDRVMQFASISFDIAIEEIFPTWICGATLVLRTEDIIASIDDFINFVEEERITILDLPTAFWHEWVNQLDESRSLPDCLRLVVVGGEKASRSAYTIWNKRVGTSCRWLNTYGPTETTVTATLYDPIGNLKNIQSEIPIGKPIANVKIYVLDSQMQQVLVGTPGELYIGGLGVAIGYHNLPEVTLEKFIPNPFSELSSDCIYKTGDFVRYLADGNLEFIGRIDSQVKIRGFRIELGEIEAAIANLPDVQQVAVIVREESPTDKRIIAYLVAPKASISEIRESLSQRLPEYMLPSAFVVIDGFPLRPNGKIDLDRLPAPNYQSGSSKQFEAPRTPLERQIADIWSAVLRLDEADINSNFFELGGHSLLATQIIARLRKIFTIELSLRTFFEASTIADLSERVATLIWAKQSIQVAQDNLSDHYEEGEL